MKIYIVLACLLLAVLAYSFVTDAFAFSSDHKFLFRKVYSQDTNVYPTRKAVYELTPLIQGSIYKPNYFYLPERNQYLIKTYMHFPDVMDTEMGWPEGRNPTHRYLLISQQGQTLASFDTDINFSRFSGIFFAPGFYIDWLASGSTTPKSYTKIVNKELNFSQKEFTDAFRELHAQADYVEYVGLRQSGDDLHQAGVVFKIKGEWTILLSGLKRSWMNQKYNDENPKTAIWDQTYRVDFEHYDKGPQDYPQSPPLMQLIPLESDIEDPYIFRNYPGAGDIKINKFEKDYSEMFNVSGTAYLTVRLNDSRFKIKIPEVYKLSIWPTYNLGVRIFRLPGADKKTSLEFLEITQNVNSSTYPREGVGIYISTERQGENFSIPNDLPLGISEKRFNSLPVQLQKALLQRDTAQSLVLESHEYDEWFPEIELLTNLRYLKFKGRITKLPDSISKLSNLQMLDVSMNKLGKLPDTFSQLKNLRHLTLNFTELKEFPIQVLELPELRKLDLGHNPFTEIPPEISRLKNLIGLDLSGSQVTSLPDSMADMKNLTITTGQYTDFNEQFPEKFQHLFVNKLPDYWEYIRAKKESAKQEYIRNENN